MSQAVREILVVLAVAVGGLLLAAAVVLAPWHPGGTGDRGTIVEVHPPVR